MNKANIRDATEEEAVELTSWGQLMFEESQFSQYEFDQYKVLGLIKTLVKEPNGIALVAEVDGNVVGGMIGVVTEHFFGSTKVASDYAVFLAPEFRKDRTGLYLVKAYIAKAKELGADEITIGNSTGVDFERVATLFERMGFIKYGYNLRMNVKET